MGTPALSNRCRTCFMRPMTSSSSSNASLLTCCTRACRADLRCRTSMVIDLCTPSAPLTTTPGLSLAILARAAACAGQGGIKTWVTRRRRQAACARRRPAHAMSETDDPHCFPDSFREAPERAFQRPAPLTHLQLGEFFLSVFHHGHRHSAEIISFYGEVAPDRGVEPVHVFASLLGWQPRAFTRRPIGPGALPSKLLKGHSSKWGRQIEGGSAG